MSLIFCFFFFIIIKSKHVFFFFFIHIICHTYSCAFLLWAHRDFSSNTFVCDLKIVYIFEKQAHIINSCHTVFTHEQRIHFLINNISREFSFEYLNERKTLCVCVWVDSHTNNKTTLSHYNIVSNRIFEIQIAKKKCWFSSFHIKQIIIIRHNKWSWHLSKKKKKIAQEFQIKHPNRTKERFSILLCSNNVW